MTVTRKPPPEPPCPHCVAVGKCVANACDCETPKPHEDWQVLVRMHADALRAVHADLHQALRELEALKEEREKGTA